MQFYESLDLLRDYCAIDLLYPIVVEIDILVINTDLAVPSHWFLCNFVNSFLLWLCLSYIEAMFLIACWSVIRVVAGLYLWYILLQKIVKILIFLSKHQILGPYKETLLQLHVSGYCELFSIICSLWCFDQSYIQTIGASPCLDLVSSYFHSFSILFPAYKLVYRWSQYRNRPRI